MFLLRLPDDILLLLADNLSRERDVNALAQTSHRLYRPLNRFLYQYNIWHSHCSALRWGVSVGCEGTVRNCLELGAPLDSLTGLWRQPERGWTFSSGAPFVAIKNGHDAAVRVLLAREATNVTLPSVPFSQQPLHYALERGSLEYVLLLLGRGADIQEYESRGARALHPAVRSGSRDLVEFLIGRGSDPLVCCGYTALSLAAVMGHQSLVQYFLAHGVDPNIRDRVGSTALGHAAKEGHADVVKTLLAWGIETESRGEDGETALSWAARQNHETVVDLLLQHRAHPTSSNSSGISLLYWAVTNGSIPIFKALLAHGARLDIGTSAGETLLHIAVRRNNLPLVEMLIQLGIEVDKPDKTGQTPFALAAACGRIEIMEFLLASGADMTLRDHKHPCSQPSRDIKMPRPSSYYDEVLIRTSHIPRDSSTQPKGKWSGSYGFYWRMVLIPTP
ncbi:ankyrin-3 [Aspergillus udagawae]|nr:ankyrin-3 [Aspergillus udagawae]